MDESLVAVAHANGGYLMRHQLIDLGLTDALIRSLCRAGDLKRVRHGTYVPSVVWDPLDDSRRHAILARSVVDKLGPGVVVSHQSAAALHGLDLYDVDLSAVHLTRLDGRNGRTEAGVVFHEGRLDQSQCAEVEGRLVTEAQRTVLELGATTDIETGVVLFSSALRLDLAEKAELDDLLDRDFARWKGTRSARMSLRLADGRLETVGEARSLVMMWRHKVPAPELQVEVLDQDGRLIGRSDFGWSWFRHLGEFDGLLKYGRLNPFLQDPGQQIEKEKVREDRMRSTRRGMTRWIWVDLHSGRSARTAGGLQRDMDQSRSLYTRNATHIA